MNQVKYCKNVIDIRHEALRRAKEDGHVRLIYQDSTSNLKIDVIERNLENMKIFEHILNTPIWEVYPNGTFIEL